MKSINIIDDHLCPVCQNKIGLHNNSPFGHNPKMNKAPTGESDRECNRSYNSLLIEKLTAWWNDAMNERDAYMKSYEDVRENVEILHKEMVEDDETIISLSKQLDEWKIEYVNMARDRDANVAKTIELQGKCNILELRLGEYEGKNKRWHSFETMQAIVKERDELQGKLNIAVEAIAQTLVILRREPNEHPYTIVGLEKALAEIEGEEKK